MGRLIDADEVKKQFPIMENDFGMVINERLHKGLDKIPTVEAIPKDQYEARLKADMVAMLEEISLKFDEQYYVNRHQLHDDFLNRGLEQGQDIIQQKINELKGEQNK